MPKSCESVEINGQKYIRADINDIGTLKIVIAQRGWMFVGRVSVENDVMTITSASVVRRWGTTKGIGELARKGPLNNTIIDKCPPVQIAITNIIATVECVESSWT